MRAVTQWLVIEVEANHSRVMSVPGGERERIHQKLRRCYCSSVSGSVGTIGAGAFIKPETIRLLAAPAIIGMVIENNPQTERASIIDDFVEDLNARQPLQIWI